MYTALEDIKVIDFTQMIAGPYCSMCLADMGAEVIKIEHPERGDLIRRSHPHIEGESYPYLMLNRNKRSLAVDLTNPKAQEVLRELIDKADVLVCSLRPGALDRYGMSYERLAERNPRLVYCAISGFGVTGPYSERGGYDLIAQAASGMMSVTGEPGGTPTRCGFPVLDVLAGSFALSSILAALREREKTQKGQLVDVSLVESGLACGLWQAARFFHSGEVAKSHGTGHPAMSPYQVFKGSDRWFALAINSDRHWPHACKIMGLEELVEDPRFLTGRNRYDNRGALLPLMEARFATQPADHWIERFVEVDIPCGPVNTIDRALENPHIQARGMIMDYEHPELGALRAPAPPMRSSSTKAEVRSAPPGIGEHTEDILRSAGLDQGRIEALVAEGAFGRRSKS